MITPNVFKSPLPMWPQHPGIDNHYNMACRNRHECYIYIGWDHYNMACRNRHECYIYIGWDHYNMACRNRHECYIYIGWDHYNMACRNRHECYIYIGWVMIAHCSNSHKPSMAGLNCGGRQYNKSNCFTTWCLLPS